MDRRISGHVAAAYRVPDANNWQGRSTTGMGKPYWYQNVVLRDWSAGPLSSGFGLIGYACDEGVRRNQGRVGAAAGPTVLRQRLGRLAWHHGETSVVDYGDVICPDGDMETAQSQLAAMVAGVITAGQTPIVLGGGHDMAYGHFRGVRAAKPNAKTAIVNLDAHFDLRPVVDRPNSGTPFWQILEEEAVDYTVLGIQRQANTATLFSYAEQKGVKVALARNCQTNSLPIIRERLNDLLAGNDRVYLTIDLDGFSSAYAPGVSAPSPLGFDPAFVLAVMEHLLSSGKVVSVDFAELNPTYDVDGHTARLAAGLVDLVVGSREGIFIAAIQQSAEFR